MAHGYPPRRPPAGAGGEGYPDGPGGRHGYPDQSGDDRGYADQPDGGYPGDGYPDDLAGTGYPGEPAGGGYTGEPRGRHSGDGRGDGGYADDPHGRPYPDERHRRRGYPEEAGSRGGPGGRGRYVPARRPERVAGQTRERAGGWDEDDDVMPWTGPGIYPVGPGRRERRPPPAEVAVSDEYEPADEEPPQAADGQEPGDGLEPAAGRPGRARGRRAAAARARKSRRRLLLGGGLVVAAAVVVLAVFAILGKLPFQSHPTSSSSGLVTTYQPGEFHSVPDACHAVTQSTLSTYLPGKLAEVQQQLPSNSQSECTWTLDALPNFRVLTVASQAYAPSLLTSGNGSATAGAVAAYQQQLQALRSPPKSSKLPAAQIGAAVGLGSSAFTALQTFQTGGDVSDEVTVVVRDRNVVITVTMQGQESGGGFGPVPETTLRAAALAAAHEALAQLG